MQNEHQITVNKLELASELADEKLKDMIENEKYTHVEIYEEDDDEITYTELGQDLFNELYDYYLNLIENSKI